MKKVTLQEIAASLGISRTTVWKVFSGHEGVSDSLKSRIIAKAQELGYEFPENFQFTPLADEQPPVNIAVAVCRPETSLFWMNIIHQIAKEFTSRNINLVYVYLPTSIDETYVLPAALTGGTANGMIVLNVYNQRLLHRHAWSAAPYRLDQDHIRLPVYIWIDQLHSLWLQLMGRQHPDDLRQPERAMYHIKPSAGAYQLRRRAHDIFKRTKYFMSRRCLLHIRIDQAMPAGHVRWIRGHDIKGSRSKQRPGFFNISQHDIHPL